ncbi:hypothetical protein AVEN_18505-1 [Araneus ventricosus]|uniref:Uncharacterized protein n=1 Tax=Araneus ventricosus TaxID=182803 RepID=A0A4Y2V4I1_ARAVE|nr:hypothetical protein AVEN_18505-1 [Araneus ventricosus]
MYSRWSSVGLAATHIVSAVSSVNHREQLISVYCGVRGRVSGVLFMSCTLRVPRMEVFSCNSYPCTRDCHWNIRRNSYPRVLAVSSVEVCDSNSYPCTCGVLRGSIRQLFISVYLRCPSWEYPATIHILVLAVSPRVAPSLEKLKLFFLVTVSRKIVFEVHMVIEMDKRNYANKYLAITSPYPDSH